MLKHNYAQLFDNETLVGLQFELETLSPADNTVDYDEFARLFLERSTGDAQVESRPRGTTFQIQDYEDLLGRIAAHVRQEGLDLLRIFKIFAKQTGFVNYEHLKKIFEMVGFAMSDQEFALLVRFADESADGQVSAAEFANQVIYARELAPQFDINKWIVASRYL